jgi:hypothetical protein
LAGEYTMKEKSLEKDPAQERKDAAMIAQSAVK